MSAAMSLGVTPGHRLVHRRHRFHVGGDGLGHGVDHVLGQVARHDEVRRIADHGHVAVLLGIGAGFDRELDVAGVLFAQRVHRLVVHRHELDVARAGEVHHRRGGNGGAEREHLGVAVLHQRHAVGVGLEIDLGERLVVHAVELENGVRQQLGGVALGLGHQRLAFQVGEGIHVGVGQRDHLKVLRIQIGELADLGGLLRIGRAACETVHRGARVAEAGLCLAFVDPAHVGDTGARRRRHLQARNGFFPHALELAAERHPDAALRAGHEGDLLGCGRSRECSGAEDVQRNCEARRFHGLLPCGYSCRNTETSFRDCVAACARGQAA